MEVENIKKSFRRLKEGEKGKNFDKKMNSLTRYKIGGGSTTSTGSSRRTFFFLFTFFFANPIPSSDRPSVSLRSKNELKKLAFSLEGRLMSV